MLMITIKAAMLMKLAAIYMAVDHGSAFWGLFSTFAVLIKKAAKQVKFLNEIFCWQTLFGEIFLCLKWQLTPLI